MNMLKVEPQNTGSYVKRKICENKVFVEGYLIGVYGSHQSSER